MIVMGMVVGGSGSTAVNGWRMQLTDGAGVEIDSREPGSGRPLTRKVPNATHFIHSGGC